MYNSPIHTIWFNGAGVGREKGWKNKLIYYYIDFFTYTHYFQVHIYGRTSVEINLLNRSHLKKLVFDSIRIYSEFAKKNKVIKHYVINAHWGTIRA